MVPHGNPVEADFVKLALGKVRLMSGDTKSLAQGCTMSEEQPGDVSPGLRLCLKSHRWTGLREHDDLCVRRGAPQAAVWPQQE